MSATFCSLLWNHLFLSPQGDVKPCCRYRMDRRESLAPSLEAQLHGPHWTALRDRILKGERLPGCGRCHEEEDAGKKSLRERYNEMERVGAHEIDLQHPRIRWLEVALSNRCNLACVMCDSRYSTRWVRDEQALGLATSAPPFELDLNLIREVAPHLRHVKITGGEPLLDPRHETLLEILRQDCEPHRMFLNYSTNMTLFPSAKVIDHWREFDRVEVALSLDSIDPAELHYLRYPTPAVTALRNVQRYFDLQQHLPNLMLILRPTISLFNVHSIAHTLAWWFDQRAQRPRQMLHQNPTHLTLPHYLHAAVLTPAQKHRVIEGFRPFQSHAEVWPTLQYLENFVLAQDLSHLQPEFERRVTALDQWRGLDHRAIFAHLRDHG